MNRRGHIATALLAPLALVLVIILVFSFIVFKEDFSVERQRFANLVTQIEYKSKTVPELYEKMIDDSVEEANRIMRWKEEVLRVVNESVDVANKKVREACLEAVSNPEHRQCEQRVNRAKLFKTFAEALEEDLVENGKNMEQKFLDISDIDERFEEKDETFSNLLEKAVDDERMSMETKVFHEVEIEEVRRKFKLKWYFEDYEDEEPIGTCDRYSFSGKLVQENVKQYCVHWDVKSFFGIEDFEDYFKEELEYIADGRKGDTYKLEGKKERYFGNVFDRIESGRYSLEVSNGLYRLVAKEIYVLANVTKHKIKQTFDLRGEFDRRGVIEDGVKVQVSEEVEDGSGVSGEGVEDGSGVSGEGVEDGSGVSGEGVEDDQVINEDEF